MIKLEVPERNGKSDRKEGREMEKITEETVPFHSWPEVKCRTRFPYTLLRYHVSVRVGY